MRALHYSVVMKWELSKMAKLLIFKAVFVSILTYGHESWGMTERMRSQVQASEMRFLRKIEGVTLFNKVRSSEIRKFLNIEPLLVQIERSQLRWFGHVSRMPQERLPKQGLLAKANGRRPVGRPRTRSTDYIEDLGWNRLGLRPSEMMEVMEDREVWRLNLELLPPLPSRKSGLWKKRRHFHFTYCLLYYAKSCNEFTGSIFASCRNWDEWRQGYMLLKIWCKNVYFKYLYIPAGEPLATLRPTWLAQNLNLRLPFPETNVWPLNQLAGVQEKCDAKKTSASSKSSTWLQRCKKLQI